MSPPKMNPATDRLSPWLVRYTFRTSIRIRRCAKLKRFARGNRDVLCLLSQNDPENSRNPMNLI
ncbi:hypothetical protein D915_000308 [Fasciola hepatica]|uniref:Uncharacterized protein n=1 Tax=Fasciola hepatica TaxID=6192 RepID=A0A4E0RYD9_FASHE|nr:hypothetical protein D915_000308 [Fasciola hepatica]